MKTATLFLISLFFFAVGDAATACPVYHIGDIKVIDQYGNAISGAAVYKYSSLNDSFKLRNKAWYNREEEKTEIDSNVFSYYSSGGWYRIYDDYKAPDKLFRVTAPGYADVILNSVKFNSGRNWSDPILEVVLYAKQMIRVNQSFKVFENYHIQDEIVVVDSLRIDMKLYQETVRQEANAPQVGSASQIAITAFPNPVADNLHIQMNFVPRGIHRIVLSDANGKVVHEAQIETSNHDLLMTWYAPGVYYLSVYDPVNTPLLRQQIIHK